MVRIRIYLTEAHQQGLRALASRTGRSRSDLIREAIDSLLAKQRLENRVRCSPRRGDVEGSHGSAVFGHSGASGRAECRRANDGRAPTSSTR
jgi:Arc/MetJ-type ribon-helix-helix transcriptional regulator